MGITGADPRMIRNPDGQYLKVLLRSYPDLIWFSQHSEQSTCFVELLSLVDFFFKVVKFESLKRVYSCLYLKVSYKGLYGSLLTVLTVSRLCDLLSKSRGS